MPHLPFPSGNLYYRRTPKLALPGIKAVYLYWHKLLFNDDRESLPAVLFEPVAYALD